MYDLLIKSATIIDGTGRDGYRADIGISNSRIAAIGEINPEQAGEILDASGLVVSPGFIDSHSHSDTTVYRDPSNWNKLEQGITTDIAGMCGLTLAPISRWMHSLVVLTASETFSHPATARASRAFYRYENFRRAMDQLKLGTNMAVYAGHHLIRGSVMGMSNRLPRADEMRRMKNYLCEAMECGALGLSLGLIYPPGAYAGKEEIGQLCQELARFDGRLVAHMRSESDYVVEAMDEMLAYGRNAQIPVIISHHKACGKQNWGKSVQTLEMIDRANREGVPVWLDSYPYTAGATGLRAVIPPRFHAHGKKNLLRLLNSTSGRNEIRRAILAPVVATANWENFHANSGFDGMLIANALQVPEVCGKTISEIARERGVDPFDALFDLLLADNLETNAVYFMMDWGEVKTILTHPRASVGTDGAALTEGEGAHPRWVGTFPRFLSKLVREEKLLGLPQAIHKITALAAESAGLPHKGCITEGWDADLVLFDPDTIDDTADFINYRSANTGIHAVLVGGALAVKDGKFTGVNNGKFIWKN